MTSEVRLAPSSATSAAAVQAAIDSLGAAGGRVVLPEMELVLDRGLELRSNVELVGQGRDTVLRKGRGRIYPLAGYHNYGMLDVPLQFTDGLEAGMTVAVRDRVHGGFFETFGRITWVDGTWVGLDCGLHSDYAADQEPVLVTSFPLVYGLNVENVAVRSLTLDGNRDEQPAGIGACRGAAIYFIRSHHFEVSDVQESGFAGEGLGFQMCSDVRIRRCHLARNAGNAYHPGAGSTAALFEECVAEGNAAAGFFFCVRANHITVRDCVFAGNGVCGVSVGTRDCYNRIESCRVLDNDGPGILFRPTPRPVEVHSCVVSRCQVSGNARVSGHGQIDILGDAHDLVLQDNEILGLREPDRAGVYIAPTAERIWLEGNDVSGCFPAVVGGADCLAVERPSFASGVDAAREIDFRHLLGASAA
jgi:hypothetical protein